MNVLPPPPNWDDRTSPLAVLGFVVIAGGVIFSSAQVVLALRKGAVLSAVSAGGLAVLCFGAVLAMLASRMAPPSVGRVSTTLRINPCIVWCYAIALVGGLVGSTCYLLVMWRGGTDLPLTSPGRNIVTQVLMGALLLLTSIGLSALAVRREPGYLRLSRDGFVHADIFRTQSAPWQNIKDISDKGDKNTHCAVVFARREGDPIVVTHAGAYAPNGAALYWMIRHYWLHPENRHELDNGKALERLRNQDFIPE